MDEDVDALEGIPLGNERHLGIKELKRDGGETIRHRQADDVEANVRSNLAIVVPRDTEERELLIVEAAKRLAIVGC
jgi:hypothetical protein